MVVSVFPAYPYLLETILGGAPAGFPAGGLHHRFDHGERDLVPRARAICFSCLTNKQRPSSPRSGVPDEKVRVTGFPVTPKFAELGELRQAPARRWNGGFFT